ncbi:Ferredoxin--NADP reductase 1 [Paenibacillus sp. JJ-100]|uniref:FAD-dependent oxidoreductase n=1 Tax=Paenibacillus sp. JJ-100 TaxID=2974896 RepID=UPI0022FF6A19|nr:FAD-dependent oxidoreductase [Paenibacillus sp. JJ-100]CAI6076353.1 Ferredoxin--NADP reductase 1 [Paenibacillus sp. JJ-100]
MRAQANIMTPYSISRLCGTGDKVELSHIETGEITQVEVDKVVVSHGYDRDFGNLVQWGLEGEDYGVSVDQRVRTNIPGIFGAGTCCFRYGGCIFS